MCKRARSAGLPVINEVLTGSQCASKCDNIVIRLLLNCKEARKPAAANFYTCYDSLCIGSG